MRNIVRFVFAAVLCLPVDSAFAQPAFGTAWACWYDGETSLYCVLQSAGPSKETVVPAAATGRRLQPNILHAIRNDPASVVGLIVIPTHTVPYDMDFARELAQSVMCGVNSACTVNFGRSYAETTGRMLSSK